jgi:hypothetical protein
VKLGHGNRLRYRTVGFSILILVAFRSQPVAAKCGYATYSISLSLSDASTGSPLAAAQVLVFLPGETEALAPTDGSVLPTRTDAGGVFKREFSFNTHSGWALVDLCNARLTQLEIVVVPAGRLAKRFFFKDLKALVDPEADVLRLPALRAQF